MWNQWPIFYAWKARSMWIRWNFFNKIVENLNFDLFWGPNDLKILHTSKSSCNELINQHAKPVETSPEYTLKTTFDLFWPNSGSKRARKYGPHGPFSHTPESTHNNMHVSQLWWSHIKKKRKWLRWLVKMQRNCTIKRAMVSLWLRW